MEFRRQVRTEENINLTPLIDVVFLLLIFFMVSTTFTKETHLAVDLRYERQRRRLLFGGLSQLRRTHEERLRVIGCHVNEHL